MEFLVFISVRIMLGKLNEPYKKLLIKTWYILTLTPVFLLVLVTLQSYYLTAVSSNGLQPKFIVDAAKENNIPPHYLLAVIATESNFKHDAISHAGAAGLAQLMPATIEWCGIDDPFIPKDNVECGAKYLNYLRTLKDGDIYRALGAYYTGPNSNNIELQNYYVTQVLGPLPPVKNTPYTIMNDLHGLEGFKGIDLSIECGKPLVAPLTGLVTFNGCDGLAYPNGTGKCGKENTMLVIEDTLRNIEIILLHGDYTPKINTYVLAGYTPIGKAASNGNSSGCHEHYVLRLNGKEAVPSFVRD